MVRVCRHRVCTFALINLSIKYEEKLPHSRKNGNATLCQKFELKCVKALKRIGTSRTYFRFS